MLVPYALKNLLTVAAAVTTIASTSIDESSLLQQAQSQQTSPHTPVPALQVINVYGRLAGSVCFGNISPPGSSCQLPLSYLKEELHINENNNIDNSDSSKPVIATSHDSLTRDEFKKRLEELQFQWPLKPYGIEKSLTKTSIMNKGAETALYMDELERRGFYDRRNPTGPLPTSLRPKLNEAMNNEIIDEETLYVVFQALSGDSNDLTKDRLEKIFDGREALDYYSFVGIVGNENISWPRPAELR